MFKKKRRWHCISGQEPTDLDKKVMFWENKGKLVPTRDLIKTKEQIEGIIAVFSPSDKPSNIVYCPEKRNCDDFVMDITNITEDLDYHPQYDYLSYLEDYKKEMERNLFR